MTEETKQKIEKKEEDSKKMDESSNDKSSKDKSSNDKSSNDKKDIKKTKEKIKEPKKKYEAVARGQALRASKKHCIYICSFIKNKKIDEAIADLESVIKLKKAIPFKGEIPHRKGDMMSGRYPVKTSKQFIPLLQSLKGNLIVNGLDLEISRITTASASWAARPLRKGRVEAKRTNVILMAKEIKKKKENK